MSNGAKRSQTGQTGAGTRVEAYRCTSPYINQDEPNDFNGLLKRTEAGAHQGEQNP